MRIEGSASDIIVPDQLELQKAKLQVSVLKKVMQSEQDTATELLEAFSNLGRQLDIRA